ncbi:hypothetical protein RA8P2_00066 (plasmid) [Variovorax sp. RA8]|nr:hypothetical protein RA8P2_00066 [Variovorax sp. RA8]
MRQWARSVSTLGLVAYAAAPLAQPDVAPSKSSSNGAFRWLAADMFCKPDLLPRYATVRLIA